MDGERGDVFMAPAPVAVLFDHTAAHEAQDRRDDFAPADELPGALAPVRYIPRPPEPGETQDLTRLSARARKHLESAINELGCGAADLHTSLAYGGEISADFHERVEATVVAAVEATLRELRVPVLENQA